MKVVSFSFLFLLEIISPVNAQNSINTIVADSTFSQIQKNANKYYLFSSDTIYVAPDKNPSYVGGDEKLMAFIKSNMIYPKEAQTKHVQGTVVVSCVIDSKGKLNNLSILHGIGNGCDEEALRILKLMPSWMPGYNDNKRVSVKYFIPVTFSLK